MAVPIGKSAMRDRIVGGDGGLEAEFEALPSEEVWQPLVKPAHFAANLSLPCPRICLQVSVLRSWLHGLGLGVPQAREDDHVLSNPYLNGTLFW